MAGFTFFIFDVLKINIFNLCNKYVFKKNKLKSYKISCETCYK